MCILLGKCIYGNVDAALCFYMTYTKYLITRLNMIWSYSDLCLFYKLDASNKLVLVVSCHVDSTMIAGTCEEVDNFKRVLKECFNIKELGPLTKHLGIKYSWDHTEDGNHFLVARMDDLIFEIINIAKSHLQQPVMVQSVPVRTGASLLQEDGDIIEDRMYRQIVGIIMYLTNKLMIEGANSAREMSKFFMNPKKSH